MGEGGSASVAVGPRSSFLIRAKDAITLPLAASRVCSELAASPFYVLDLP